MAGSTAVIPNGTPTDAELRTIVQAFTTAFAGHGLIQTADTGQIDPLTVVRAAANTAAGYQIWRFDDAFQATVPVFVKIEYGSGGVQSRLSIWITVGTGSDGAGNLTGVIKSRTQCAYVSSPNANTGAGHTAYFWSSTSRMAFLYCKGDGEDAILVCIERLRDAVGAITGDGVSMLLLYSTTPSVSNSVAWFDGGASPAFTKTRLQVPSLWGQVTKEGSDVLVGVQTWARPTKTRYSTGVMSVNANDIDNGQVLIATVLGATRQVMPLTGISGASQSYHVFAGGDETTQVAAMTHTGAFLWD